MSVPPSASSTGRSRRITAAVGTVVLLSVPMAVLFGLLWGAKTADYKFNSAERRGTRYLEPVTQLVSTLTGQQSAAVRGRSVDTAAVRRDVAAVDAIDHELGGKLGMSDRWAKLRQDVQTVTGRSFADPTDAFTEYSGLLDKSVALIRDVGDASNLILDPQLDTYYVMNAVMLRVPDIIVDGGRYSDLVYLVVLRRQTNQVARIAQLDTARLDVTEASADLADGLEKAFDATRSDTLGPAMLRELDNYRTAADALAPRTAPTQPNSLRLDPAVIGNAQEELQRTALALDKSALGQLDLLLGKRVSAAVRELVFAGVALLIGIALVVAGVVWLPARRRRRPPPAAADPPAPARPAGRHGERRDPDSVDARELVASSGLALPPRRGGTRVAR
ncbi:MAG TPA: hypothetical protein VMU51_06090 [Mycobacteriales bacterium]|nr:hypothetical protein [Mycobacteriales bacterium]